MQTNNPDAHFTPAMVREVCDAIKHHCGADAQYSYDPTAKTFQTFTVTVLGPGGDGFTIEAKNHGIANVKQHRLPNGRGLVVCYLTVRYIGETIAATVLNNREYGVGS